MKLHYLIDQINSRRTVIFDLDNTIYDEKDFLSGSYKLIALKQKKFDPNIVYNFLIFSLYSVGPAIIFDKLFQNFPGIDLDLDDCLHILRNYRSNPLISPYKWYFELIDSLDDSFIIRIITNGNVQQQMNKISSIDLRLPNHRCNVIYANSIAPKPSPASFYAFRDFHEFNSPIYVGDSAVDRLFCKNLSIEFLDVDSLIV